MSRKLGLGIDVLSAARDRIAWTFDTFQQVYVSFSGGKDSTVMLHLTMDEAARRGRRVGVLFVDLEAQYKLTIEHIERCFAIYAQQIDAYWLSLPISLRNAVSQFQPKWQAFDPDQRDKWVRAPPAMAITDPDRFPWFRRGMEFEELVPAFGHDFAKGALTACLVGIRSDESLNRFRTLIAAKTKFEGRSWTTWCGGPLWNIYPIYDWKTEDIWTYHGRFPQKQYNRLYDLMHKAGLTIHQARICQPYGDDQRRGLWLYHVIEPETWGRVVARVAGVNGGAIFTQERGNAAGYGSVTKPTETWREFAELLLATMPPILAEHYRNKVAVFLKWYADRGYPAGIPDEGPMDKGAPSWARVCKALLRNDYWCKGLSFSQQKTEAYSRYLKVMKRRRADWGII